MFGNLRITVYELLGFFVPGMVAVSAAFVLMWAAFFPTYSIPLRFQAFSVEQWLFTLLSFYLAGHLMQAISNKYPLPDKALEKNCMTLCQLFRDRLEREGIIGSESQLSYRETYLIASSIVSQFGSVADQDVYVYREGFYRGTSLSMFVLSASVFVRCFRFGATIRPDGLTICRLPFLAMFTIAAVCLLAGYAFLKRYYRFSQLKAENAFACALLINPLQPRKEKDQ